MNIKIDEIRKDINDFIKEMEESHAIQLRERFDLKARGKIDLRWYGRFGGSITSCGSALIFHSTANYGDHPAAWWSFPIAGGALALYHIYAASHLRRILNYLEEEYNDLIDHTNKMKDYVIDQQKTRIQEIEEEKSSAQSQLEEQKSLIKSMSSLEHLNRANRKIYAEVEALQHEKEEINCVLERSEQENFEQGNNWRAKLEDEHKKRESCYEKIKECGEQSEAIQENIRKTSEDLRQSRNLEGERKKELKGVQEIIKKIHEDLLNDINLIDRSTEEKRLSQNREKVLKVESKIENCRVNTYDIKKKLLALKREEEKGAQGWQCSIKDHEAITREIEETNLSLMEIEDERKKRKDRLETRLQKNNHEERVFLNALQEEIDRCQNRMGCLSNSSTLLI